MIQFEPITSRYCVPLAMAVIAFQTPLAIAAVTDIDFASDVLPILQRSCFRCHEGRDAKSGVRLDQRSVLLGYGGQDALVVPNHHAKSRLWEVVSSGDPDTRMPPDRQPLKDTELEIVQRWINGGMVWDLDRLPEDDPAKHWAFQRIKRPTIPDAALPDSAANPIDVFVSAMHQRHGLRRSPTATKPTLIRRLSRDMLGVPPTFADVQGFDADRSIDAWTRLVDRVLALPQYGERWGRHWLDVARWAESEGYESNHPRATAWRYRDYVINSFNIDRPFRQFIWQQIAGDELPEYSDDNLIATGYLAAARISSNEEDKWKQRNDVNVDIVNAVGNTFMGLTMQCAQCHDHKFDAITARDYYRLQAYFVRGQPVPVQLHGDAHDSDAATKQRDELRQALQRKREIFAAARKQLMAEKLAELTPAERKVLNGSQGNISDLQELATRQIQNRIQVSNRRIELAIKGEAEKEYSQLKQRIESLIKKSKRAFVWYSPVASPHRINTLDALGFYPLPFDPGYFSETRPYVMPRGNVHVIGERVTPGVPAVFGDTENATVDAAGATGAADGAPRRHKSDDRSRSELARWLTSQSNPLVARVWVNRIWAYHFGRGLVETVDDFGVRGARPTHPRLLDWLASELIESGWSTKHIHRLILTSRTWRQSVGGEHSNDSDPGNRWLTRWSPRRLEAEAIRDSMLAASGLLDRRIGGTSVPEDKRETSVRRSIYLFQKRGRPAEMQALFDGPNECSASKGERQVSTSPLQPLYLLNSEFSLQCARTLASRVEAESGGSVKRGIELAFNRTLQRSPNEAEVQFARQLLLTVANTSESSASIPAEHAQPATAQPVTPLILLCQSLLSLNEFAYLD